MKRTHALALAALALAAAGGVAALRLHRAVTTAASEDGVRARRFRPLAFRPFETPDHPVEVFGDGTAAAVGVLGGDLVVGGGSGLSRADRTWDVRNGFPSERVAAAAAWRSQLAFAFERGGWGRLTDAGVEEATTGWGALEVRAFAETEGGELLIGARQGLFRAAFASNELERLDAGSVRCLALLPGGEIAAGGESGLRIVSGAGDVRRVTTPDPWIEDVAFDGTTLWATGPAGTARGPLQGESPKLDAHPRGGDATRGVFFGGAFRSPVVGGRIAALQSDGSRTEELTPEPFRRLFTLSDALLADGPSGLYRKDAARGWTLVKPRRRDALPLPHVNALAVHGRTLWAGFFDGGLSRAPGETLEWKPVEGTEAWGVNALLPAGGALFAATLRGAFRVEGDRLVPLEGAGGAFSLAATSDGIAVGYGQGVYLPEKRLLSAFHGLPGNQAYALASTSRALWVGTPTGLGRIERRRVSLRTVPGEGKLPHPWVTSLAERGDALLVATYGGGVARRTGDGPTEKWRPFVETEGLKVNAGSLVVEPSGRVWLGTQGKGVWRTETDGARFSRVDVPLPSPDVFSLTLFPLENPEVLFVGTSEGLARVPLAPPSR